MADPTSEVGPNNPSSDYQAMAPYWAKVEAILGGAETMRAAGQIYLPKFENESAVDYESRRKRAPFTDLYGDISGNLAAKPFSRELALKTGSAASVEDLCEDIDGQGNNLHVFGEAIFQRGIDKAIDWILVDYTKTGASGDRPLTVAAERQLKVRPYWVHVPAERMLAAYSDRIEGREVFVHARIHEPTVRRDRFGETTINRVRVLDRTGADGVYAPATYEVFEEKKDSAGKLSWVSVEGPAPITIGVIPLVPFVTGKREGTSWRVKPPLQRIVDLQLDAFQQESNLRVISENACYPMLAGNGVSPAMDEHGQQIRVPVGPRGVLFAPMGNDGRHGRWEFIEPSAESIRALMSQLDATQKNMRDLGMQPLTQANITVITAANVAVKAHSAVQAWALKLKDALEQALKFTALWLRDEAAAPEVDVYTDFGIDFEAATELESLLKAQAQGVLSKRTTQDEFKRRGVLSDNFDAELELKRLKEEMAGATPVLAVDPITGERTEPLNRPLVVGDKPAVAPPNTPPSSAN